MPKAKDRQFTIYLPGHLADRVELCARYSAGKKAPDTIVSDLVAACMEDLTDVLNDGAERVEKLLQLLQQGNVNGYAEAVEFIADVVERVTMEPVVLAREAQGLERLASERSENDQRPVASTVASAYGASDSSDV